MLTVGTCKQKHCECFHSHHSNVQSGSTGCFLGKRGKKKVKVKITILSPPHCALHLSRVFLQYRTNNAVECLFNVLEISFTAKTFHSGVSLLHKVYYICSEGLGDLIKVWWWTALCEQTFVLWLLLAERAHRQSFSSSDGWRERDSKQCRDFWGHYFTFCWWM